MEVNVENIKGSNRKFPAKNISDDDVTCAIPRLYILIQFLPNI